jgi:NhaP-type Na+/H+ and K+/H+ antiporter
LVKRSADSQQALLTFHSELAFLVRTFFFVLIGAVAQLDSFRRYPLLMAGTVASLFLARWLAIQSSKWSWREISAAGRESILWMLPRGLITVVLAIQVTESRPAELAFLPGLAFAVILVTNLMVVAGSLLAPKPAAASADGNAPPSILAVPAIPRSTRSHRRWLLDAVLLFLLAIGGFVVWYSKLPFESRILGIREWVRLHVIR